MPIIEDAGKGRKPLFRQRPFTFDKEETASQRISELPRRRRKKKKKKAKKIR